MKRIGLILALSGFSMASAWANARAPLRVDGFFSGSLKAVPLAKAVRLLREDLRFVFPPFQESLFPDGGLVGITVRYEIANDLAGEVDLTVHFLAVDIKNLTASLEGQVLSAELAPDSTEKSECLWRIARHRAGFFSPFYKGFLAKIRESAGLKDSPDAEWLSALEGRDLAGIEPGGLYSLMRLTAEVSDFRSAGLRLRLKPGINVLQISYSQRMFIDERGYGYLSHWPEKGFSGVDYLLYPATSWPLDASFRLLVSVEIPELPAKQLLWRTWLKPMFQSNLSLHDGPAQKAHIRLLRGEFAAFPSDILTVLVWFDPKALRDVDKWSW